MNEQAARIGNGVNICLSNINKDRLTPLFPEFMQNYLYLTTRLRMSKPDCHTDISIKFHHKIYIWWEATTGCFLPQKVCHQIYASVFTFPTGKRPAGVVRANLTIEG